LTTKKMEKEKQTGRPKKEKTNLLDKRISFAVTEKEYKVLTSRAEQAGLKIGVYAREMTLKGNVKEKLSKEQLSVLKEVTGVANNLNQLVKALNYFVKQADMKGVEKQIKNIDSILDNINKIQISSDDN
jgi:hypothetical protein